MTDGQASDLTQTIVGLLQNMQATNERLVQELRLLLQEGRPQAAHLAPSCQVLPPFPAFDRQVEPWTCYMARLEQHFMAYNVLGETQQRAFLLAHAGPSIYQLIQHLHPDEEPNNLTYGQIKTSLSEYFDAQIHVAAARHKFFNCQKKHQETYREWIARLQGLSRDCKFACTNPSCQKSYSASLVRDMILVHAPDESLRHDLLKLRDPSLDTCLPIIRAFEQSQRSVGTTQEPALVFSNRAIHPQQASRVKNFTGSGTPQFEQRRQPLPSCKNCFIKHTRQECKFRKIRCTACGRKGHKAEVCRSSNQMDVDLTHEATSEAGSDTQEVAMVNALLPPSNHKMFIQVHIKEQPVKLQVDTGSAVSIINKQTHEKLGSPPLSPFTTTLKSFTNDTIMVEGAFTTCIQYGSRSVIGRMLVVPSQTSTNILGLDIFHALGLQIHNAEPAVQSIHHQELVDYFKENFSTVFQPATSGVNDFQASITLLPQAVPKFYKSRTVPYALKDQVRAELQRLQEEGAISPIHCSKWATPIVLVEKPNGALRICGDFKHTINAQTITETYPIPKLEDIVNRLAGGKLFAKIDLKDAYLQLPLDDAAKEKLVINTPFGLFRYNRLPFGLSSAPAIFQRYLEQLIRHIPGTANYLDDIIVAGRNRAELVKTLSEVFSLFQKVNLKCNIDKCVFGAPQVEYIGFTFCASGIKPTPAYIEDIQSLAPPTDITQLQSVLGQINYYRRFIPHAAAIAEPLYRLLRKGVSWHWSDKCAQAFEALKRALLKSTCLCAYDPTKPLVLATDASDYGVGAVLSHVIDGIERPIAFVSKSLTVAQRNYSQIEKEALAIIFGVKKFHDYLYGRHFTLQTDHKPLLPLFKMSADIPTRTARRIQRWALFLAEYNYDIQYRSSAGHANADFMSRLSAKDDPVFDADPIVCFHLDTEEEDVLTNLPLDAQLVAKHTAEDAVLKKLFRFIQTGWPGNKRQLQNEDLKAYWDRRHELSTRQGVILWRGDNNVTRVIIPAALRKKALDLLHKGHWGIVLTKQLARKHLYWRGMDRDISETISKCQTCQQQQAAPPKKFFSWPTSAAPWTRIHIDYAGPFLGHYWLIVVDSASGFPYVSQMSSTTSSATIQALARIFAIEGLPHTLVSDNGPQFTSDEFSTFCLMNGITLIHTAPFHPASNGLAERFVRTFKVQMAKLTKHHSVSAALSLFLSSYRAQPRDGGSPAEKLHGRQPRSTLSLLQPRENQEVQPHRVQTKFQRDQKVWVNMYTRGRPRWLPGMIARTKGRAMYEVVCSGGAIHIRHQNQIRPRRDNESMPPSVMPHSVSDADTWEAISDLDTHRTPSSGSSQEQSPHTPMEVDTQPTAPLPGAEPMDISPDECLHLGVSILGGEECRDAPHKATTSLHSAAPRRTPTGRQPRTVKSRATTKLQRRPAGGTPGVPPRSAERSPRRREGPVYASQAACMTTSAANQQLSTAANHRANRGASIPSGRF